MGVLDRYYTALAAKDWRTIAACYHDEAHFGGPVFPDLDADQVRAMWKMLLTSGTDLRITFKVQREDADGGMAQCEAFYTFSRTGRKVHNRIASEFTFRNGLIHGQRDRFGFWRWSRQALGPAGWLLGWTPVVRDKVRRQAARSLARSMP